MPDFDIIRKSDVKRTFRVAKVMSDFDLQESKVTEHFKGSIQLPPYDQWSIGLIVGNSGTGKTTIARELFGDYIVAGYEWHRDRAVIDEMPEGTEESPITIDDITRTFFSVGFASVPSWLKPFDVLSNGEKMRVELARAILEAMRDGFQKPIVFDEFTSVVDRTVAQTACIAIAKAIHRFRDAGHSPKFIAVTCHSDVEAYLQPDWVFDTNNMTQRACDKVRDTKNSRSPPAPFSSGSVLGVITI